MINKEILALIEQGFVVVTPTQALAHHLQSEYAAQQISLNKLTWPSVDIVSWNACLQQLWQQQSFDLADASLLLSRHQSLLLWNKVIESSKYAKQLLQIEATARQVQAAYRLCKDWNIETIPDDYFINQDTFAFKVWMESYELRCKAKNYLDEANLIAFLLEHFDKSKNKFSKLALYAFDDLTPQQKSLLDYLEQQAIGINSIAATTQNVVAEKRAFADEMKEVEAIADWIIDSYKHEPNTKIGVVVPNLNAKKHIFQVELAKRLSIQQYLDGVIHQHIPFTISLGKALKEYSMIRTALTILSLNPYRMDLDNLSLLLRSVHITGNNNELNQRHVFDAELKKLGQPWIKFTTVIDIHDRLHEDNQCAVIIAALKDYFSFKQENLGKQSLREWSKIFAECLKIFLWPGDEKLNSDEYQTWEAWQDCLGQLAALNIVAGMHDFYSALNLLNNLCGQIQFQPKTQDKNIFIMGVEGASGMQFDHCWFAGLDDTAWPQNLMANSFLPLELQRELDMPGSSVSTNLNYAKRITESLMASCKNMVLSYSIREGDNELRPSPLLNNIPLQQTNINSSTDLAERLFKQQNIEYLEFDPAPQLQASQAINGSTFLFKDQAACPFKAFAKHRLNAESLNQTELGLNAIDRGIIIHRVLQLFWEKIKHSEQLRRLSESVLEQKINEVVSAAIQEQQILLADTLRARFIEIEQQRLARVLKNWIEIEKQRDAFTVEAVEKGHHVLFEGITLHMRLDRLDRLADGRLLIIDYKTGEISQNAWFGERPEDPQLPLYAITTDGEVAGLAFAKLKVGDYRYLGISDTENLLPKIKALPPQHWQQCLEDWQRNLSSLAVEFRQGNAAVEPMPGACRYCDLPGLCRINERIDASMEEDE